MTPRHFYDWQTNGGVNDVMRMVECLERAGIPWCAIGGIAVNHWAQEPMVTRDVDIVMATGSLEKAVSLLEKNGFTAERFKRSINLKGGAEISIQIRTEEFYKDFPARSVPADIHGILMRVASLEDTLEGKIRAWNDEQRRQSKRIKDLADISRLVEAHPDVWDRLTSELKKTVQKPEQGNDA
ncbi:MAG: nucleotidyl transferase AbiEii/AbiGii toxin family protein [Chitinispirillaceae bacterium]|nr:nucleotidyl transferase AbiEii/AbiGii toxin family protein [Chitinispirillaceae bacterium]